MAKKIDPEEAFTLLEKIGQGSFGVVHKGLNKETGQTVAIKIINLDQVEDDLEDIQQEISMLSQVNTKYVTRFFGAYTKGSKLYIIMEHLACSALDVVKACDLDEVHIAVILHELLMALEYLHGEGRIHRDVKAANILLSPTGEVKLADFGVAAQVSSDNPHRNTFVGTPNWMAPEIIKHAPYNEKVDIWSLGITAIELAKKVPPYFEFHPMRALFLIDKSDPPVLEGNYSKAFKEFVSLCLNKTPELRPSASQLLKHRFFKNVRKNNVLVEVIEKYLEWRAPDADEDIEVPETVSEGAPSLNWTFENGTLKPTEQASGTARSISRQPPPNAPSVIDIFHLDKGVSNDKDKPTTAPPPSPPPTAGVPLRQSAQATPLHSRQPSPANSSPSHSRQPTPNQGAGSPLSRRRASVRPSQLSSTNAADVWTGVLLPTLRKLKADVPGGENAQLAAIQSNFEALVSSHPAIVVEFLEDVIENVRRQPALRRLVGTSNIRSSISVIQEAPTTGNMSQSAAYLLHRWRQRAAEDIQQLSAHSLA